MRLVLLTLLLLTGCGEGEGWLPDGGETACPLKRNAPCASWDSYYSCGHQCVCVPKLPQRASDPPQTWADNQQCFDR